MTTLAGELLSNTCQTSQGPVLLAADFQIVKPRRVMLASPKLRPLRRAAQVVKLLLAIYALRKVLQRLPELLRRYLGEPFLQWSATRMAQAIKAGEVSSLQVVEACIQRIRDVDVSWPFLAIVDRG